MLLNQRKLNSLDKIRKKVHKKWDKKHNGIKKETKHFFSKKQSNNGKQLNKQTTLTQIQKK